MQALIFGCGHNPDQKNAPHKAGQSRAADKRIFKPIYWAIVISPIKNNGLFQISQSDQ